MTPDSGYPIYSGLIPGELARRIERGSRMLAACSLCPRLCGIDRRRGEHGFCKGGFLPRVSSFGPHFGEEACLVGTKGSGTIFFTGCNLQCCFCQNYEISHYLQGKETTAADLAATMLRLEQLGCHNINLVTPTHFTPQIVEAIAVAAGQGLSLPIVYNCGGYEALETLRLLEGMVDIYMPDFKFWNEGSAVRYCGARDYPEAARVAIREMHRQVGDLEIRGGLARRGLLVRHLVMPGLVEEAKAIFGFLAGEISKDTFVNVMDQYRPCYRADRFPEIGRRLTGGQFEEALELAAAAGLTRIYS